MMADLAVGNIFLARTIHGADLILVATAADERVIEARGINLCQEFRFDRQTGDCDLSPGELFFCRIGSIKPPPPDIRDILIEYDRKNRSDDPQDHGPPSPDERLAFVHMASHYFDAPLMKPDPGKDRAYLLSQLRIGDIFYAEPAAASAAIRYCLVVAVNETTLEAHSIGPGEQLRFDRRTGIQIAPDDERVWIISSVEALPADLHAIAIAQERRYRFNQIFEQVRLTEAEMAGALYSHLFYIAHPLPAVFEVDLAKAGLIANEVKS